MDPAKDARDYRADAIQCMACAAIAAEQRDAAEAHNSGKWGKTATDGLYISVRATPPKGGPDG